MYHGSILQKKSLSPVRNFFFSGHGVLRPIATLYRENSGLDIFQISLIESISLVLCVILEFPWGVLADRIGYRKTMIFCTAVFFLSKIIFWQADPFHRISGGTDFSERCRRRVVRVDTSFLYLWFSMDNFRKPVEFMKVWERQVCCFHLSFLLYF